MPIQRSTTSLLGFDGMRAGSQFFGSITVNEDYLKAIKAHSDMVDYLG